MGSRTFMLYQVRKEEDRYLQYRDEDGVLQRSYSWIDEQMTMSWTRHSHWVDVSLDMKFLETGENPEHLPRYGYDWIMKLYRVKSTGERIEIGHRGGYVTEQSSSHRSFSGIGDFGDSLQVEVRLFKGTINWDGTVWTHPDSEQRLLQSYKFAD